MPGRDELQHKGEWDRYRSPSHSFILRVWREESVEDSKRPAWRGHITHVMSGDRGYVQDIEGIEHFLAPYFKGLTLTA